MLGWALEVLDALDRTIVPAEGFVELDTDPVPRSEILLALCLAHEHYLTTPCTRLHFTPVANLHALNGVSSRDLWSGLVLLARDLHHALGLPVGVLCQLLALVIPDCVFPLVIVVLGDHVLLNKVDVLKPAGLGERVGILVHNVDNHTILRRVVAELLGL